MRRWRQGADAGAIHAGSVSASRFLVGVFGCAVVAMSGCCCEKTTATHPCARSTGGCNRPAPTKPAQQLLPSDTSLTLEMAADATHLYYGATPDPLKAETVLYRIPKTGGAPGEVFRAPNIATIHVDADHVYFVQRDSVLMRTTKQGGSRQEVHRSKKEQRYSFAADQPRVVGVTTDEARVYLIEREGNPMRRRLLAIPKAGGSAQVLLDDAPGVGRPHVGDEYVYFVRGEPHPGIVRIAKAGGEAETVVEGRITTMAAARGWLVWVTQGNVVLARKERGGPRTWIGFTPDGIDEVRMAGAWVVWTRGALVEEAPLRGGDAAVIALERNGPLQRVHALAADDTAAYWIGEDSAIRRVEMGPR